MRKYLVGVVGVSLEIYHAFSLLEVLIKIDGYLMRLELENYLPARNIYTIIHNANAKYAKSAQSLWPLGIDMIDKKARIEWMDKNISRERLREWALEKNIKA